MRKSIDEHNFYNLAFSDYDMINYRSQSILTCGEATRRLVIPQRTVNVPMISLLPNIEDEIRDILDGFPDEDNNFADVLELMDDHYEIKMFDACGMPANIEINHSDDFVNMIVFVPCLIGAGRAVPTDARRRFDYLYSCVSPCHVIRQDVSGSAV